MYQRKTILLNTVIIKKNNINIIIIPFKENKQNQWQKEYCKYLPKTAVFTEHCTLKRHKEQRTDDDSRYNVAIIMFWLQFLDMGIICLMFGEMSSYTYQFLIFSNSMVIALFLWWRSVYCALFAAIVLSCVKTSFNIRTRDVRLPY